MSAFKTIVGVLSEHPDYSTQLNDDEWRVTCDGPGCAWYSGPLPPASEVRGAGTAERVYREHVAGALVAALPGPPLIVQMGGAPASGIVHMEAVARCALCGGYRNAASHAGGCPSAAAVALRARLQKRVR